MKINKLLLNLGIISSLALTQTNSYADEIVATKENQKDLFVTIYNTNLALIKDSREVEFEKGINNIAFKDVSAQIRPNTLILSGKKMNLLEQNFEYDLITPIALLDKYIGKKVTVIETNPTTGTMKESQAIILSNNSGVMLKMDGKIRQANSNMQFIYGDLPKNLRDKPTMTMLIDSEDKSKKTVELSYLTGGLSWSADYVVNLVDEEKLDLKGWVTLDNKSGTPYLNTNLQLVAGDLNEVPSNSTMEVLASSRLGKSSAKAVNMQEESLFEYHLYTLPRKTSIKNNQTKQVSLLEAKNVPYQTVYKASGGNNYQKQAADYYNLDTAVFVEFDNEKTSNLGIAIPKGVIRTYKKDKKGNIQFVGEDRISHTPENEKISIKLGNAFDITVKKKQTNYSFNSYSKKSIKKASKYTTVIEASYEVKFSNAKNTDVTVNFDEFPYGNWKVISESIKSEKINSSLNRWKVKVPAKGSTTLTYKFKIEY